MADADKDFDDEERGGGFLKSIIVPVVAAAVTAAIVGAVFTFVLAPQPTEPPSEIEEAIEGNDTASKPTEADPTSIAQQTGIYHSYDPFIVSIFDREKVHYLKVVLSLELSSEVVKEEIQAKNPQIRDAMIMVLSDFTLRELLDNQAKHMLKDYLIKTLNKILGKGKVLKVYFTEFTIQ